MTTLTIQDLQEHATLDAKAMADIQGGHGRRRGHHPRYKHKRKYYVRPVQRNNVNFGSGNSFIGNTTGVNNGSMTINGGIHL